MKWAIVLCSAGSFVMAFLGTVLAAALVLPGMVEAEEARIRAESITLVGDNGVDRVRLHVGGDGNPSIELLGGDGSERIRLQTGPGIAAGVTLFDPQGGPRVQLDAGGAPTGGTLPGDVGFNVFADDGTQIIRLGTAAPAAGGGVTFALRDPEGRNRIRLGVASDGTPSIRVLEADGSLIWTAP